MGEVEEYTSYGGRGPLGFGILRALHCWAPAWIRWGHGGKKTKAWAKSSTTIMFNIIIIIIITIIIVIIVMPCT